MLGSAMAEQKSRGPEPFRYFLGTPWAMGSPYAAIIRILRFLEALRNARFSCETEPRVPFCARQEVSKNVELGQSV